MQKIKRIGSTKQKYTLRVYIHHININLKQPGPLQIALKRRKKQASTDVIEYDKFNPKVIIEKELAIEVSMYSKGAKYMRKLIEFLILKIEAKKAYRIGKAELEFSEIAQNGEAILTREIPIKISEDKTAYLCVSADLTLTRNQNALSFSAGELKDFDSDFLYYSPKAQNGRKGFRSTMNAEMLDEDYVSRREAIFDMPSNLSDLWPSNPENSDVIILETPIVEETNEESDPETLSFEKPEIVIENDKKSVKYIMDKVDSDHENKEIDIIDLSKNSFNEISIVKSIIIPETDKISVQNIEDEVDTEHENRKIDITDFSTNAFHEIPVQHPFISTEEIKNLTIKSSEQYEFEEEILTFAVNKAKEQELLDEEMEEIAPRLLRGYSDDIHLTSSSDSSSSEEIAFSQSDFTIQQLPSKAMSEIDPNINTKSQASKEKETEAGIGSKRSGSCLNCTFF